ncbi:MAG: DMT family transporter [Bacillota bacterium]|nr:DMT family transporter [Bacillota bacterium]
MKNNTNLAYVCLLLTFFLWGSVYVASKLMMDSVPIFVIACIRPVIAVLMLGFISRRHLRVAIDRADLKYLFIIGFLGYYATPLLNFVGIKLSGAAMASLINSLNPVMITIVAMLILREKMTRLKLLCLILALGGALIVSSGAGSRGAAVGILFVLASVISWSFASTFLRKLTPKYGAMIITLYGMLISLIFHIPSAAITIISAGGIQISPLNWALLIYLGLFGTAAAHTLWSKSLSLLPASTCSLFYPLQAVFAVILGFFLLDEHIGLSFAFGALLIVADIVLNFVDMRRQQRANLTLHAPH